MTDGGMPSGPGRDSPTEGLSDYDRGRLEGGLRRLAEAGASALEVAHAAVWLFDSSRDRLYRTHMYHRSCGEHSAGGVLYRGELPAYFDALEEGVVVVRDAATDARIPGASSLDTCSPGITAWIDVPAPSDDGGLAPRGIVRFEHLGPARDWTEDEVRLAEGFGHAVGALLTHFEGRSRSAPPRSLEQQGPAEPSEQAPPPPRPSDAVPPEDSAPERPIPPDRPPPAPGREVAEGREGPESGGGDRHSDDLLRRSAAGLAVVTAEGVVRSANPAFARMMGYSSPDRAEGVSFRERCLRSGDWEEIVATVREQGRLEGREIQIERSGGGRSWLLLGLTPVGEGDLLLASAMNITDRKSTEERLERLANRDPLTGVANRRLLQEAAENALALADRHGRQVALLYIDLRRFKEVNDQFGHEVGDRVLTHVADRLRARGRESDLTARIGGDEFAVLLSEVEDGVEGARRAAERLMEGLRAPIEVGRRTIDVEVTIGVAVYPDHARDVRSLLRLADEAMYRGKGWEEGKIVVSNEGSGVAGGGGTPGRDTGPGGPLREREGEGGDVHEEEERPVAGEVAEEPLDRQHLELHWQPIERGSDGEIVGAEALLRGRHPRRGLLPAREFVDRATELGWIASFDRWVLEQAVDRLGAWLEDDTVGWIALNVAPQSLLDSEYMEALDEMVESGALPSSGALIQTKVDAEHTSIAEVGRALESLRSRGFGTALDLTGESEEMRGLILSALEVDVLEVTPDLLEVDEDGEVGGALGEARRKGGAWLLAKRIESEEDRRRARSLRCELIEGHLVGRPVSAEEFGAGG